MWNHHCLVFVSASLWLLFAHQPNRLNSTIVNPWEHWCPSYWLVIPCSLRPDLREHHNVGESLMLSMVFNWMLSCREHGSGLDGALAPPSSWAELVTDQSSWLRGCARVTLRMASVCLLPRERGSPAMSLHDRSQVLDRSRARGHEFAKREGLEWRC